MAKRSLEIQDKRAGKYFRRLESFLGSEGIDRRLSKIDKQIRSASPIYLKYWILPRVSWWLGFNDARKIIKRSGSFRRAITLPMERPLQTAVKLSALHHTMSDQKRAEFRSRILADDILEPTLFEIDSAAHFWHLGYDIEWFDLQSSPGVRTPEFIAKCNGYEIEVECKSKQADAGRRINRANFYRIIDLLFPIIQKKKLKGNIFLTVPSRLSGKDTMFHEAKQAVEEQLTAGSNTIILSGGERFDFDLQQADGSEINQRDIGSMIGPASNPYAHYALMGLSNNDTIKDLVVFRLESKKPDAFLDKLLESLEDAEGQFTGNRSSLISCMIPEIDSFEGIQSDSALQRMTYHFFEKSSKDFINAVSYVSEVKREVQGQVILSDMPSLSFRNHKYDDKYGLDIPVYH